MDIRRSLSVLASLVVLVLVISAVGVGEPDAAWSPNPRLDWQELNAEHVRVLYTPDLADAALIAAAAAERAHRLWEERLGATPPATPTIVLSDRGDEPRSRLQIVPHPVLYLDHPVPRSSDGWTTLHGSGLVAQVMSGYGRIVDQTRVGDFSEDVRAVIGAIAAPGVAKPLYLREGLPVLDGIGAGTALPEMAARVWSETGDWPTLAGLSTSHVRSNGLAAEPLAGALGRAWLDYLDEATSPSIESALSELYAERPIVPLMADPLFATIGRSSAPFYRRWVDSAGQTPSREPAGAPLSPSGRSLDPAWAPDGTALVYRHQHAELRPGIRLATADGTRDRALIDGRVGPPAWSRIQTGPAQTATVVYPKAHQGPEGRRVKDLVEYRLNSGEERRLTTDERIEDVVAYPNDPNRFLVTRNEPGLGQSLVAVELIRTSRGHVRDIVRQVLRTFPADVRVLGMDVAPDGARFALSLWRRHEGSDLVLLDRWGQTMTPLVSGSSESRDPAFSPEGRWLLFADDRRGVPQIYARNLDSDETLQVTETVGGAFDPSISPTGERLAFVSFGADGHTVRTIAYDPDRWSPTSSFPARGVSGGSDPELVPLPRDEVSIVPYRPGSDLIPTFWMPLLVPSNVGVYTQNVDPVGQHSYDVSMGVQFAPFDLLYAFRYTNAQIYPNLSIELRGTPAGAAETVRFSFPLQIDLGSTRSLSLGWSHEGSDNTFFLAGHLTDVSGIGRFERTSQISAEGALIGTPQSPSHRIQLRWQERIRLPVSSTPGAHHLIFDIQTAWSDEDAFRLGGSTGPFPLRGAARGVAVGHQLARASLDYRFPVWRLQWACCGATPWPVFLDTLASSLFVDIGTAGDALDPMEAKLSAGVEFQLGVSLGYGVAEGTLRAGLAYRLDTDSPEIFLNVQPRF